MNLSDVWFDRDEDGSELRISVAYADLARGPDRLLFRSFWCPVPCRAGAGALLRFEHIANLKGRSVYGATEFLPAGAAVPDGSGPVLLLGGPHQKSPSDKSWPSF